MNSAVNERFGLVGVKPNGGKLGVTPGIWIAAVEALPHVPQTLLRCVGEEIRKLRPRNELVRPANGKTAKEESWCLVLLFVIFKNA